MRVWAVLVLYACLLAARLPAWRSDITLWTASATSDPDDPFSLLNAAHWSEIRNPDAPLPYLLQLGALPVPTWLPRSERQPYLLGYYSLAEWFRQRGRLADSQLVMAYAKEVALRP